MSIKDETPLSKKVFALSNSNRRKIYHLCLKEKLNIKQISEKIGLSYNSTFENLNILEENGFIEKDSNKGSDSIISSIPINSDRLVLYNLLQEFDKEDKEKK